VDEQGLINPNVAHGGNWSIAAGRERPFRYRLLVYRGPTRMRDGTTAATFTPNGWTGRAEVEVLGEGRRLELRDGAFRDTFRPWDVRLYRIRSK
jgi:hypothetical protein